MALRFVHLFRLSVPWSAKGEGTMSDICLGALFRLKDTDNIFLVAQDDLHPSPYGIIITWKKLAFDLLLLPSMVVESFENPRFDSIPINLTVSVGVISFIALFTSVVMFTVRCGLMVNRYVNQCSSPELDLKITLGNLRWIMYQYSNWLILLVVFDSRKFHSCETFGIESFSNWLVFFLTVATLLSLPVA